MLKKQLKTPGACCRYCLPNGDSGIIRTLDAPVYITRVFGNIIYCLDRDGKNRQIQARPLACNLTQEHCWVSIAPAGRVKRVMGHTYNIQHEGPPTNVQAYRPDAAACGAGQLIELHKHIFVIAPVLGFATVRSTPDNNLICFAHMHMDTTRRVGWCWP